MDWKGRPVVVTGAGGFIGSHLTERLLRLGARVRAMAHGDPRQHPGWLAHVPEELRGQLEVEGGDLRDFPTVRRLIAGADTVFHLGAVTSVAYSYQQPRETFEVNALGTLHVCEACRDARTRRLVHTSTAGVYGNARDDQPITEDHPVAACNPYTAGKLAGDMAVQTYCLSYDLPAATIRLFNVYGPRMGSYLIMPTVITQLMQGSELRLGDLTPIRPFVYVDDILDAYLAMADAECVVGEVVHFGSEHSISMAALVALIADLMGVTPRIIEEPSRLRPRRSEIYRVRVDCGKARRLLSWTPGVSLDTGLRETIRWVRQGGYTSVKNA